MIFSKSPPGSEVPAVRAFLLAGASGLAPKVVRRNRRELELIFQAFSVLVRRRLGRAASGQVAFAQFDRAADLVRLGLGRDEDLDRVRRDPRRLQLLVIDLVRGFTEKEVTQLLATAQAHAARFAPAGAIAVPRAANQPSTVVGRSLNAIGRYDLDELGRLPEDPSDRGVRRVCHLAFSYAVHERFGESPDSFQIGQLARNVAKLAKKVTITAEIAESVIRRVLEGLPDESNLDPDVALETKILIFARTVEDLGLYETELNSLIHKAEQAAEAEGIELTQMSSIA